MAEPIPYREFLKKRLQDLDEAEEYLKAALKNGDPEAFFHALKDIADAHDQPL